MIVIETVIETETVTVIGIGMKDREHHQEHPEWEQHQERLLRALLPRDLRWIKEH